MINDKNEQRQDQHVSQHVVSGHQAKIEVPCPHYTDDTVSRIEGALAPYQKNLVNPTILGYLKALKEARVVSILQDRGRVTRVLCPLLKGSDCTSPRNAKNRCHLLDEDPFEEISI